ncbi:hypothetical protein TorRG33x02_011750 [Trema orientale]|uniref:Uncharacterized protein n=1 Tax=Trema orientale TaxID=63057 RepID=A0A2P5FZ99_TREOI|nr:hypothetical protein TorRG33x02_011750 [Trema orientale]
MKRHNNLELQAMLLNHLNKLSIAFPIVVKRPIFLHQAPPCIHHDSFNSRTLQCHKTSIHGSWLVQVPSMSHRIQRKHHENRHSRVVFRCMRTGD